MTTDTLIRAALDAGVELRFVDGKLRCTGRTSVLRTWAPRLRARKPELTKFLIEAHESTNALVEAAMRACDHHGDGPAAREEMRQQCLATPPHLQADLADHFKQTYSKGNP